MAPPKVVEVCRVAPEPQPGSPDSDTSQCLPLTFFDLLWLRFPPTKRIFLYELSSSNSNTNPLLFDSLLPKLKTSLSLTLQHFVPLAGNLTWPQNSNKPILNYVQGDTVSLTIAEYEADFHYLSSTNFLEAKEFHPLVPHFAVSSEKAAVMALQITVFPNHGFSIGTAMHHAVIDGKTSTSFFKLWARICKHGGLLSPSLLSELKPCYDRMGIQDQTELGSIYSNHWLNIGGPNNRSLMVLELKLPPDSIRGSFEFTRAKIQTLRQLVMTAVAKKKQDHSVLHLSTFSLVCAYTWVCLAKAQEIKAEKMLLAFSVDCRSRLDPPLPATYFGNCIASRRAVAETKGLLGEDGLVVAVNAISEAIKSLDKTLLDGAETWVSRICNALQSTNRVLPISSSHRFEIYGTDFGWGRPRRAEVVSIDRTGAISISDSRNGGGAVEVGLVLKKHHMEAFASLFAKGLEER